MKRNIKKILFTILIYCLMFSLIQTALAATDSFRTTDNVNFRTSPSTNASVIKTLSTGSSVTVLTHDPANWSQVMFSGSVGYIRSDFLKFPVESSPGAFKTTGGVNIRTGPSTDANIIRTVGTGTVIELLEHDPAGWSNIRYNGTEGYIKSSYLIWINQNTQPASAPETVAPKPDKVFRTIGSVNLRTDPTTDSVVVKLLNTGTVVEMLEYNPDGWSKVRAEGSLGFIRSDLLIEVGSVELLDWTTAKNVVPKGELLKIIDVRTGMTFNLKCFSKGGHADVEPPTKEDTDTIYNTRNGVWSWDARPVWVIIGDRTLAASMNGQPHAGSTISGNGMNGHLCLHFNGTVTNSKSYQKDLNNAVMEAWNAAN